jgi:diguanylate cyclase (GGDEF)-like protein/PAS domain S-box-containing protein
MLFILQIQENIEVVYANQTAQNRLQYSIQEMNSLGVENFRKPIKNNTTFTQHLNELSENLSATDYAILVCKDQSEIPVEVNAKIITINNQTYNVAIARDISERLIYEEKLEQEVDEKTKQLQENLSILKSFKESVDATSIVTITNIHGVISYANENFCALSQYSLEEVLGKTHAIVRHKDTPNTLFQDLWQTITAKKIWHGTIKNKKKNGENYIVDTVITPILNEDGTIKEFLSIRHDITEITNKQEEIYRLAHTDALTGLKNRFSLNERLQELSKAHIALIDMNRFHEINDFYGENVGDKVIKALAKQIEFHLQKSYEIFHLQGDQFIILNTEFTQERFSEEMLRLNTFLSNKVLLIENRIFYVTTTVALSFEEPTLLLSTVNLANTYAKQKGLTFSFYSHENSLEETYKENLEWVYKIRKALLEDRFIVYFQPIVDTKTQEIHKYEALVRMQDVDGKIISPFFFLEQAKRSNQYIEITKKVIQKTMFLINTKNILCGINITIEDIESDVIRNFIFEELEMSTYPQNVTFELVESEGINNFEDVERFIQQIKSYGCSVAIDDFGTGYSNFEYLLKLQTDTIKIDGSLIKDIDTNQDKYDIVQTIVSFAKIKKLKVVAEFVSSESIYKTIQSLGIDLCQGYYFGEPKPFD